MDLLGVPCKFKVVEAKGPLEYELNTLNEKYVVIIEATVQGSDTRHNDLVLRLYEREDIKEAELASRRSNRKIDMTDFQRIVK